MQPLADEFIGQALQTTARTWTNPASLYFGPSLHGHLTAMIKPDAKYLLHDGLASYGQQADDLTTVNGAATRCLINNIDEYWGHIFPFAEPIIKTDDAALLYRKNVEGLRTVLEVPHLTSSTYEKLMLIFDDARGRAAKGQNVALALCRILDFVRRELGTALPNPDYVIYPPTELHDCDDSWQYLCRIDDWYNILNDAAKFEETYPGRSHRRHNLFQAGRPLFYDATNFVVGTFYQMLPFLEWTEQLLKEDFEETILPLSANVTTTSLLDRQ